VVVGTEDGTPPAKRFVECAFRDQNAGRDRGSKKGHHQFFCLEACTTWDSKDVNEE
jgi:hypothetical protein